jgi:glycosyltransferase involved in cell wall biosynthesis
MKNESKHLKRFYESCKEADGVYILDTGSTDDSVAVAKSLGNNVYVSEKSYPKFRFDVARNDALDKLPKEDAWVIHLDIDEILVGNWKDELSQVTNATCVNYLYVFDHDKDNNPRTFFKTNKITRNGMYRFRFPVHETVFTDRTEVFYNAQSFRIDQIQDTSKNRDYTPLLEEAVKEYPSEDMLVFYLIKAYFISGNYGKCIDMAQHMFSNIKNDFSMVACLIAARSFEALGVPQKKEEWLLRGIHASPFRREAYMELLRLYYFTGHLERAFWAGVNIFNLINRRFDFIEMAEAWGDEPHRLFIDICQKLGHTEIAKKHLNILNGIMTMRDALFTEGLNDLIQSLEGKNLIVAEVGSYAGESTSIFAKSDKISKVYAIDPWLDGIKCEYVTFQNMGYVESLFNEKTAGNPKIVKMKMLGEEASKNIDDSLDVVYIDAVHTYEAVKTDMPIWYPKVKIGGYLCGHDYDANTFPGVFKAVNEFCVLNNLPSPKVFKDTSWVIQKN